MGNITVYTFNSWDLPEFTIEPATTAHPNAVDRTWTTVYDKAGQAVTELLPGGVRRERTYDGLGRLTHKTGTGAEAVTNDADGNMTERSDAKNATSYGYDSAGRLEWLWNQMTGADIWYEWDAAGNRVKAGSATATYDERNRLLDDGTSTYRHTPRGSLLAGTDGTTAQWSITDQHTNLVAGLSVDGTEVTGSTTYDPFGTKTATEGSMPAVGYQSGWTDPDSGDVNMAARWYQPGTGGFTSRDTWQLDASPSAQANRYGYANADPLNGTDPTGHACICGGGTFTFRVAGGRFGGVARGGRGHDAAPKSGAPAASTGKRWQARTYGNTSRSRTDSRAQARNNATELYRREMRLNPTRPATSTGRPTTSRGCTYSCSSATRAHPRGPIRSSGIQGTGTVRPPKPPTPQNPNRGSSPRPAPVRPAPKPRVDVARVQERSLDRALVVDQRVFTEMALGTVVRLDPGDLNALDPIVVQPSTAAESGDASVEGPDRNRGNRCDTGAGFNAKGNIVYLPRREHAGECVATGAFANLTNADYTPPPRPGLSFPLPGLRSLPMDNRARGHLVGFAMSGSNKETRNFVPMYQTANDRMHVEEVCLLWSNCAVFWGCLLGRSAGGTSMQWKRAWV